MKLEVGSKMPNFTVDTVFDREISLKNVIGENKTILLFLRYEGCTLCRFDMMLIKDEYERILELGGKVLIVLQSDPDKLSSQIEKDSYPYEIICDPDMIMYKQLEIVAANSKEELVGPGTMEKLKIVGESGLTHGDYEGNEMQLPAVFIIDNELNVIYEHYASFITDIPNIDELVELLKN